MGLRASRQVKARDGRRKGAIGMSPCSEAGRLCRPACRASPCDSSEKCRQVLEKGGKGEDQGGARKLQTGIIAS